jgi:hypothetical protein
MIAPAVLNEKKKKKKVTPLLIKNEFLMHSLSNMTGEFLRLLQDSTDEVVRLLFFDRKELLEDGRRTEDAMEHFPVPAETFRVLQQDEGVLPSTQFAAKLEDGSIRVRGGLFVEQIKGDLGAVHDDEHLPKGRDGGDVAWGRSEFENDRWRKKTKKTKKGVCLPQVSPHFLNTVHSFFAGRSSAFPRTGRPFGPGGSGAGERRASRRLTKYKPRARTPTSTKVTERGMVWVGELRKSGGRKNSVRGTL